MSEMKNHEGNGNGREDIFSKAIRAGKRTYFFDVKATRNNDLYLTITESKKKFNKNGKFRFEKHKLFLYKEDFDKFSDGLAEAIAYIKENIGSQEIEHDEEQEQANQESGNEEGTNVEKKFSDLDFDDLDSQ